MKKNAIQEEKSSERASDVFKKGMSEADKELAETILGFNVLFDCLKPKHAYI
ncbi:hypothetical protein P22_3361 [Propionispora sp. 2/2-37]|uniref:hypothetical protein n=1 Tax=Propionispora sp. 2/2-37 TaxID=1677858 RepID=UPI0006C54178|nr:hypothetical protein [Propionispora sp. 2/2-37]CUH97234.1 hypothetical protein P22_3361 [Propionispora sp. 2/2-37]